MSGQHTPEQWGYGIVRDGKIVGVERTIAVARHWVDADYVPLVPMQQRDELLAALVKLADVFANIGTTSGLYDDEQDALQEACVAIYRAKGGAA